MEDRVPTKKNTFRIKRAGGAIETVEIIRADEPSVVGTPLNKETLLRQSLEKHMGLKKENTVSDALELLLASSAYDVRLVKLTTSGTWRAPANLINNEVIAIAFGGGGGGGKSYQTSSGTNGGGGGGGGGMKIAKFTIDPAKTYTITVGAGGKGATSSTSAKEGGWSAISPGLLFVKGGLAGGDATSISGGNGGNGGSGGGGGYCFQSQSKSGKGGDAFPISDGGYGGGGGSAYKGGNAGKYGGGGAGNGNTLPGANGDLEFSGKPLDNFPNIIFTTNSFDSQGLKVHYAGAGYGGNGGKGPAAGGGGLGGNGGNENAGGGGGGGGFIGRGHDGKSTSGGGGGGFSSIYAYGGDGGSTGGNGGDGLIILIYAVGREGGTILDPVQSV